MRTVKLSPTMRRLLLHCATRCTVECCLEGAFDFSLHRIVSWLESERIDRTSQLANEIKDVLSDLDSAAEKLFLDARDLESNWYSADFAAFLTNFEQAFSTSVNMYRSSAAQIERSKQDTQQFRNF